MAESSTMTATRGRPAGSAGAGDDVLVTEHGRTSVADAVVAKIAGIAAREVSGVHQMGGAAARAFGSIKEKLAAGAPSPTQGVTVEVGEKEAAIDLDLVVEYGVSIPDVSRSVRDNVIQRVERMTGLAVTEVNISVDDVWLGDDESDDEELTRRVQ